MQTETESYDLGLTDIEFKRNGIWRIKKYLWMLTEGNKDKSTTARKKNSRTLLSRKK